MGLSVLGFSVPVFVIGYVLIQLFAIDLRWVPGAAPTAVEGDAGQLGHLFLNLVTNGIEAAGPGGWVEVRLREDSGDKAVVEVIDSGPGPAPEVAERLFEAFVTGKKEGVWLGLAVARQVAQAHGGSLRWGREDGHTCFTVELPLPARPTKQQVGQDSNPDGQPSGLES